MPYTVLLYYRYVNVLDPVTERDAHLGLCQELGLKGRILIGHEGINGTLAGTEEATQAYRAAMEAHPLFSGIEYKVDYYDHVPFPRLRIKAREEIVTLGAEVDLAETAPRISAEQLHELIQNNDVVLFDARNNYESAIGRFRGAVTPDISLFKELPQVLSQYEDLKDRPVVTYCTGGIRCEKASALMRQQGFKNVYQLDGGIIKYAQAYPEGEFEGECFVFDERMKVGFGEAPKQLGTCIDCGSATNEYCNCSNKACNKLVLVCADCRHDNATCGAACAAIVQVPISL